MSSLKTEAELKAAHDLECISRLRSNKDFTGFYLRRVKEQVALIESRLLTGQLSKDELWETRKVYDEIKTFANLIDSDEAICRKTLKNVQDPLLTS